MGFSDIFAVIIYYFLVERSGVIRSFIFFFALLAFTSISLVITMAVSEAESMDIVPKGLSALLSLLIIGMRIGSFASFAINYSQVVYLTPTMMVGLVFAFVNTVCRGFTIFAPLVAELVNNSAWTCSILAVFGILIVPYFNLNTKLEWNIIW